MIDEDLKQKMQRLASERADKTAAFENARQEAELSLKQLDAQIEELADLQHKLVAEKHELLSLLGQVVHGKKIKKRQARGTLIRAYTEALKANPKGMISAEVVEWVQKNIPDINTQSIISVLSRGVDDGRLQKDDQGRFRLVQ